MLYQPDRKRVKNEKSVSQKSSWAMWQHKEWAKKNRLVTDSGNNGSKWSQQQQSSKKTTIEQTNHHNKKKTIEN